MKTNVILFLATLLFATSCSNKFSLVKRKYNKGFYVSVNKKASAPQPARQTAVKQNITEEKVAVEVVKAKNNQPAAVPAPPVKTASIAKTNKAEQTKASKQRSEGIVITAAADQQVSYETKKDIKPVPASASKMGGDSDVNLVLLVILAIFIPPLAVYLKHHTIDKWFWITLILTVLAYGLIFGAYGWGGLFGLAAVIIALLYVFDSIKG